MIQATGHHRAKTPVTGAASVPGEVRNAAARAFFSYTIKRRILFFLGKGHPTKAQRSGFCGEEESGEAPPAAEKASRFRGSGAIGGPEGAGNRNAATVCKGATERYEGCPPPQGVPNIAQFDPTTNGGFAPRRSRKPAAFAAPSPRPETGRISPPPRGTPRKPAHFTAKTPQPEWARRPNPDSAAAGRRTRTARLRTGPDSSDSQCSRSHGPGTGPCGGAASRPGWGPRR